MAGKTVATAWLKIMPEIAGLTGQLEKQVAGVNAGGLGKTLGDKVGKSFAPEIGGALTGGIGEAVGAVGGLLAPVAGAVGAAFSVKAVIDFGKEVKGVMRDATSSLGLTQEGAAKFKEELNDLYKASPESLSQISGVLKDVSQQLGLTGKPAEELTETFLRLSKATGEEIDAKKVIQAFQGFGISADETSATLDKFMRVSQNTGVSVDELISAISGKGQQFQAIGLSAEAAAGLMGKLQKAGIDGAQVMNGLSRQLAKSGISISDYGEELEKATKSGDTKQLQKLATMAGRSGAAITSAFKTGALTADDFNMSITDASGAVQKAAETNTTGMDKFTKGIHNLQVASEPIGETLLGIAGTITGALGTALSGLDFSAPDKFIASFEQMAENLGTSILTSLGAIDWAGMLQTAVNAFYMALTAIFDIGDKLVNFIFDSFKNADFSKLGEQAGKVLEAITGGIADNAPAYLSAIETFGADLINGLGNVLAEMPTKITEFIEQIDWLSVGENAGKTIGELISAIFDFLTKIDYATLLMNLFTLIYDTITKTIPAVLTGLFDFAVGFFDGLFRSIFDAVANFDYVGMLKKVGESILNALKNILRGLISHIPWVGDELVKMIGLNANMDIPVTFTPNLAQDPKAFNEMFNSLLPNSAQFDLNTGLKGGALGDLIAQKTQAETRIVVEQKTEIPKRIMLVDSNGDLIGRMKTIARMEQA